MAAAASFSPGALPAVMSERRLERRQCFERRVGPVVLVLVERRGSLFAGDLHRHDLRIEMTGGLRGGKALLRSQGPPVLRLAGDLVFLGQILSMPAGMRVRESVVQAVAQHAVVELAVTHAVAPANARHEVRRLVHVLHAARHRDIDVAEGNLLRSRDDRLRSGAADPVDRERRDRDRQPGMDGGLPGRIHLGAGLHDIAHDDGAHLVGAKLSARDRGADRHGTEIGRRYLFESAAEGTDCSTNRFGKDD
jgi:hypothetical protein